MAVAIGAGVAAIGAGLALNEAPGGASVSTPNLRKLALRPALLQFSQAGGDLGQLKVTRKGPRAKFMLADGREVQRADVVKFGGEFFLASGPIASQMMQGALDQQAKSRVKQKETLFNNLFGADGPQFLKDLITDRPQRVREAFAPRFQDMLAGALGAAAPQGTLTTEALQNQIAAPIALQSEQFFEGIQQQADAAQLGAVGIPGFGSGFPFDPTNLGGTQSLGTLQNLGVGAAGLGLQADLAGAQNRFNAGMFRSGLLSGAGGGIGGLFAQFGGGGGGGGSGGFSGAGASGSF